MTKTKLTWRYPRYFWVANSIELFERAAYYGMFITLTLYLTREVGYSDVQTGWIAAFFAGFIYLAPTFTGALSDKLGFRFALICAFILLAAGYLILGALPFKGTALLALTLIMFGGSIVKPVITGTVAVASDQVNRARAYSIFYQMVNIGAFVGKTAAKPLRTGLGLKYINYYSAAMALIALVVVLILYRNVESGGVGKRYKEILTGLVRVMGNFRFMGIILITAGFWMIQGQLYATMPKYALRMIGESAAPEWLANINPLMVILAVVPITHLVRRMKPVRSIGISLMIIPLSALSISLSPLLAASFGRSVPLGLFSLHPITLMLVIGIGLQGLAECFLSPRFFEYASKQAPPDQIGLYMGYAHLNIFIAWLLGFILSGYLLDAFCPDPATLTPALQAQRLAALKGEAPMPGAYDHAHVIWYVFASIGAAAFLALNLFERITGHRERE